MRDRVVFVLTLASALGSGMVSGVCFGFSTFIMRAMNHVPPATGITALNAMNVYAVEPPLMLLMFGTALVCLALGIAGLLARDRPDSLYLIAGAAIYILGVAIATMAGNVPQNDALAAITDPNSADAVRIWAEFQVTWGFWNHVRTITGLLAALAFTIALLKQR